jgi:Tfp pilus assembly major pilin PilA
MPFFHLNLWRRFRDRKGVPARHRHGHAKEAEHRWDGPMFWVTTVGVAVVSTGTGISAYMAYLTQQQVSAAVGQLGAAVGQLKATQAQVVLAQRQISDAEAESAASEKRQDAMVEANKAVAAAAQAQAIATRQSAAAAINAATASTKAAEAQRHLADVSEKAQIPQVTLGELKVGDFKGDPDKDGNVIVSITWRLNNSGGGSFRSKEFEWGIWLGELPAEIPKGAVTPGFDYVIVNNLTSGLSLSEPVKLPIPKALADQVASGKVRLFFFGTFKYDNGVTGEPRTKCFGEELIMRGGSSAGFKPAGGPAYRCDYQRR